MVALASIYWLTCRTVLLPTEPTTSAILLHLYVFVPRSQHREQVSCQLVRLCPPRARARARTHTLIRVCLYLQGCPRQGPAASSTSAAGWLGARRGDDLPNWLRNEAICLMPCETCSMNSRLAQSAWMAGSILACSWSCLPWRWKRMAAGECTKHASAVNISSLRDATSGVREALCPSTPAHTAGVRGLPSTKPIGGNTQHTPESS